MRNRVGRLALALAVVCGFARPAFAQEATGSLPVVTVTGPSVVAFWLVPASDSVLEADPDLASILDDFMYYWAAERDSLAAAGIAALDQAGTRFVVRERGRSRQFTAEPDSGAVGYLLAAPGREPRVLYGVRTPDLLMPEVRRFFAASGAH